MSLDQVDIETEMKVEAELSPELQECYVWEERLGMMVIRHPLLLEVLYIPQLNNHYNKLLERKKQVVAQALEEKDWSTYFVLYERPYRLEQLLHVADRMSDEDYWRFLSYLWRDCENHWQYKAVIKRLLLMNRPGHEFFMDDDERDRFNQLPDEITIYRGHQTVNINGWSWTLDRGKAEWFAQRFSGRRQRIATATVKKRAITAVILRRGEEEVVVNPRRIKLIKDEEYE